MKTRRGLFLIRESKKSRGGWVEGGGGVGGKIGDIQFPAVCVLVQELISLTANPSV